MKEAVPKFLCAAFFEGGIVLKRYHNNFKIFMILRKKIGVIKNPYSFIDFIIVYLFKLEKEKLMGYFPLNFSFLFSGGANGKARIRN